MPDVPTNPTEILAAARDRAGVVARKLAALEVDLAASRGGPAADEGVRSEGVARLAAAAAALAALEQLIRPPAGEPGHRAVEDAGADAKETETHDHGRRP